MASLANTTASYGGVARVLHWLTALLILTLIPLGVIANALPYETSEELAHKAWLFSLHKTLGVAVFFVALLRIGWALSQPKPALLNAEKRFESFAAELVHWLLYASLVIVPLSGWLHHAATTGFAAIWWPFGQNLPFVPKSEPVAAFFAAWHFVFTKVLAVSLFLHVAGALKHHFIDRDDTLRRMLPGYVPHDLPASEHPRAPFFAAMGLYGVAMALGSVLGLSHSHDTAPEVAQLEVRATGWVVQEGSLAITASQFGSDVSGEFGEWQAAIDYDPGAAGPVKGRVEVDIAVGSLTLGGVTSDALKPEFLDVEGHPVARFVADLQEGAEGLEAVGRLTLKGVEMPAVLPFTLEIDEDLARATGGLVIDRRDFQVGTTSYNDETTVGYAVSVDVDLLARRSE